jgi:hypothetical protein
MPLGSKGKMVGLFKSMKRILTGQVMRRSDVSLMNGACVMSFRIKRDNVGLYVVLASRASGNRQYYPFDVDEFESFVEAAIATKDALRSAVNEKPLPLDNR